MGIDPGETHDPLKRLVQHEAFRRLTTARRACSTQTPRFMPSRRRTLHIAFTLQPRCLRDRVAAAAALPAPSHPSPSAP